MPEQQLNALKQFFDMGVGYVWFILLAIWGGTVNYISRRKIDKIPFSIIELTGEWVISGFSGLITAFICQEMNISLMYTYAAAGVAGHMGGRGIYILEAFVHKRIGISNKGK